MNSKKIRSQLQSGMTIDQVCHEHQITFPELLRLMSKLGNEKKNKKEFHSRPTGQLYISEHYGKYIIRKNKKHFGTYRSLEDAVRVRDWFMCQRWDKRWVDRACRECGVVRCK